MAEGEHYGTLDTERYVEMKHEGFKSSNTSLSSRPAKTDFPTFTRCWL